MFACVSQINESIRDGNFFHALIISSDFLKVKLLEMSLVIKEIELDFLRENLKDVVDDKVTHPS